jgi:hypothetical protein
MRRRVPMSPTSGLSEFVLQKAQSVIGQAGLTVRHLGLKESLEVGQGLVEFFFNTHHDACLLYAFDRLFKNFGGHFQKPSGRSLVPPNIRMLQV